MPRKTHHVVPDGDGGWNFKKGGGQRTIKNFENKVDAVDYGRQISKNQQRLNLTKISIIAKDVSDASEDGLSLDDAARYEHRTHLKMDLLRAHLKGYLAEDYKYTKKEISSSEPLPEEGSEDGAEA